MQGNGGAASARTQHTINIGAKQYLIGKLVFRDFATAREEACAEYKRSLIQTYTKNMDLVPEENRPTIIKEAFEKAEKITADSIPPRMAYMPRVGQNGKPILNRGDRFWDTEAKQWINTGEPLLEKQEIEYSGWWMSFTNVGRIFSLWLAMRKCPGQEHMTIDDVSELFSGDAAESLETAANELGELSSQKLLGND